jgi:hypothetical protein
LGFQAPQSRHAAEGTATARSLFQGFGLSFVIIEKKSPVGLPFVGSKPGRAAQQGILRSQQMTGGTRPLVVFGLFNQARPDLVHFDVAGDRPQMFIGIDNARKVTILPDTSRAQILSMHKARVALAAQADSPRQPLVNMGDGQQVNVVVHQTVRPDINLVLAGVLQEKLLIDQPVLVIEENLLAIVAALRDMMRITDGYRPRCSWHAPSPLHCNKKSIHEVL